VKNSIIKYNIIKCKLLKQIPITVQLSISSVTVIQQWSPTWNLSLLCSWCLNA